MKRKGFTLIEIIIASTISVILIVPLMALYQQSLRETQQSFDEIQAMLYARELIDELQSVKHAVGFDSMSPLGSNSQNEGFVDFTNLSQLVPIYDLERPAEFKVRPLSTLNLSPVPANYQRLVKLIPVSIKAKTYQPHAPLLQLEVIIAWKAAQSETFNRKVTLRSLIARDEVKPEL